MAITAIGNVAIARGVISGIMIDWANVVPLKRVYVIPACDRTFIIKKGSK